VPEILIPPSGLRIGENMRALTNMRTGYNNGYSPIG